MVAKEGKGLSEEIEGAANARRTGRARGLGKRIQQLGALLLHKVLGFFEHGQADRGLGRACDG